MNTDIVKIKYNEYLEIPNEKSIKIYKDDKAKTGFSYDGPIPLDDVSVEDRKKLSETIRFLISEDSYSRLALEWKSVSIGDLFYNIMPFVADITQYLESLFSALKSVLGKLVRILENIQQKIRDIEQILEAIIGILEMLKIDITIGALTYSGSGTNDTLIDVIRNSENKPTMRLDTTYNDIMGQYHSGMVFVAGGPGKGATKALEVLAFLLTLGQWNPSFNNGENSEDNEYITKLKQSYEKMKESIDEVYNQISSNEEEDDESTEKVSKMLSYNKE
jgi:hypothetical protein